MSSDLKEGSKKRKFSENIKLFKEFKGLNVLKKEIMNEAKVPRLDSQSNLSQKEEGFQKTNKPVRKTYILLSNIDASVTTDYLKSYLSNNDVAYDKVCMVPGPLAVTFFQREKDVDRLFNICQGLHYKSNELLIVKSSIKFQEVESNTTNMSDVSVHIKNLDLKTTEDDISALLVEISKVQNISINTEKRTAIIDFEDNQSANECIKKLDNHKLGDNVLTASFLVKSQRPDQFTLKVTNLPHGFNKIDIRESFPLSSKVKVIKGLNRYCLINFKTAEDFESVLNSGEEVYVKGSLVKIEELIKVKKTEKKANYVLNIFNMPFDTTLKEIKQQYPKVRFIDMLKNPDGMFVGSAKLNFDEKDDCEEALKNTKGLTLKHRKIRAEMKVENSGPKEIVDAELDE